MPPPLSPVRFTEHQFDSLRQGGSSDPASGSYHQPEEFRPAPPPARRFQEDLLDNVSHTSPHHTTRTVHITVRSQIKIKAHFRTLSPSADPAVELRREQSQAGSGQQSLAIRK